MTKHNNYPVPLTARRWWPYVQYGLLVILGAGAVFVVAVALMK